MAADPHTVLRVAVLGPFNIRTVRAFLEGRPVKGRLLNARLEKAIREIGVERAAAPVPSPKSSAAA